MLVERFDMGVAAYNVAAFFIDIDTLMVSRSGSPISDCSSAGSNFSFLFPFSSIMSLHLMPTTFLIKLLKKVAFVVRVLFLIVVFKQ